MSLFGAMDTAISGLNAQSASFGNISDNLANSQTVGFKGTDTSFIDYLTSSSATQNTSGAVVAVPDYVNNVQGTIAQSVNPLGMAISGQGFFPVSLPIENASTTSSAQQFNPLPTYTRTGDFTVNNAGYLVNSAGEYLNGWPVNATTGVVNTNALSPIQVTDSTLSPVATTNITLSANLPATPSSTTPVSSQVTVYDGLGTAHTIDLNWTQNAQNDWTVSVASPDDVTSSALGTADVKFGLTSGNSVADGTVGLLGAATGSVTTSSYAAGGAANLSFTTNFGQGNQTINLNLGNYGASTGLTQYAGTSYSLGGLTQNGVPPGNFSSISTQASGNVVVNYSNGQTRTVAQVPIITFADPNALQRQNGEAFTATQGSGVPVANTAGNNGAGTLVVGSVEQSNVDIATEFSKLIVAQQAYSANAKVITSANTMMQTTLDMVR